MTTANSAPIDAGLLGTDRRPATEQAMIRRVAIGRQVANYRSYFATLFQLRNLSDRDLADIGIRRDQIKSAARAAAFAQL